MATTLGSTGITFPDATTQTTAVSYATTAEVSGVRTTGTITSGTTALTVASGTGTSNGDKVVGEGITPGTTISSGGGTASITLSANANTTLSSDPVSFYTNAKVLSPGSVAGMLCRAWVNFNGTGTVAIRASGNVSSITDNGSSNYTVNFTTAMQDTNYAPVLGWSGLGHDTRYSIYATSYSGAPVLMTTTGVQIAGWTGNDTNTVTCAIFR